MPEQTNLAIIFEENSFFKGKCYKFFWDTNEDVMFLSGLSSDAVNDSSRHKVAEYLIFFRSRNIQHFILLVLDIQKSRKSNFILK